MTWGKMDDKFHRNRKVRELRQLGRAGREALGVWLFWWSWCLDDPELNGEIPECELAAGDKKAAELLVRVQLWDRVPCGYRFHDFHDYNPTKAQVEHKRSADRERVSAKRQENAATVASDTAADARATSARVAPTRVPVPTRPDQTQRENPPIPPGGETVERYAPPTGGAHLAEVREGWAEAYFAANAGTPPRLTGQAMASAVAFARDVAKAHGVPLRDASREIARKALERPDRERTFALSTLDPYAPSRALSAPGNGIQPDGQPESLSEMRARLAREIAEANRRAS